MKTRIISINAQKPEPDRIRLAANVIKQGGVVAFPTETVYGLGASAFRPRAVRRVFTAKGRPVDNPVIVHISTSKQLRDLTVRIPHAAKKLMDRFWPGPLTIIFKKTAQVPVVVTANLDSVAVRMPQNKIALALIDQVGPIAAPSANLSGKPSPTMMQHVQHDLTGKIDLIIDGGPAKIGLESTVVDMTTTIPTLLRPGGVTLEELRQVLGDVVINSSMTGKQSGGGIAKAPGMKYQHYAPNAAVIVVRGQSPQMQQKIKSLIMERQRKGKVGVIALRHKYAVDALFVGKNIEELAQQLFCQFRKFDELGVKTIIVEGVPERQLGLAYMNRLIKAANKIIDVDAEDKNNNHARATRS